ncbi:hypothetical protein BDF20DRAFT_300807 [Mycotypha africana]|uniref:uncharacterized protein n=1 Tax=Mycotypha africana TaxID=64632 RepID=UPI0023008F3A|nr:uncharacterized protein BDF20DRAFT_300807 [Mycotypha africana]KAI8988009.1 hypothetical protein BDF20DRAFT_300807 [Mycotypha africana]
MDLDSSLDDIIKKKKQGQKKPTNNKLKKSSSPGHVAKLRAQSHHRPAAIQVSKAKVTKPLPRKNINARLSTGSGPLFTAHIKQQQQQQQPSVRVDPSQIIITKAISKTETPARTRNESTLELARPALSSGLAGRLGLQQNRTRGQAQRGATTTTAPISFLHHRPTPPQRPQIQSMISRPTISSSSSSSYRRSSSDMSSAPPAFTGSIVGRAARREYNTRGPIEEDRRHAPSTRAVSSSVGTGSGLSIRGRSSANQSRERADISIKGESGPTTVLVTGLDPEANSEDVYITMEPFGHILRCEVMRDRFGRSYGEAEVEFSKKHFALDAIAMLDNKMCDGQILRVILRDKPKSQSVEHFVQKQIRSIISPSSSGKMYSDRL